MSTENYRYGHADILAQYVGLRSAPQILGNIQHGWNALGGFGLARGRIEDTRHLVWSDLFLRRSYAMGYRNNVVIGSPWAYLIAMKRNQISTASDKKEGRGTIFYPFHGWERGTIRGDYRKLISQIRQVEGNEPVTVCLYWLEYDDHKIRALFEDAGFRVITHGHRDTDIGAPNPFLENQLSELLAHKRVASNRLSTAVLYGMSLGLEAGVYGDPMEFHEPSTVDDFNLSWRRLPLLYPDMFGETIPQSEAFEFSISQLGMDRVLEPLDLARRLGWSNLVVDELQRGMK